MKHKNFKPVRWVKLGKEDCMGKLYVGKIKIGEFFPIFTSPGKSKVYKSCYDFDRTTKRFKTLSAAKTWLEAEWLKFCDEVTE